MYKHLVIACTLLLAQGNTLKAQSGLSASPMKLFFDAAPGSPQSVTLQVSNPSTRAMEVAINLADWNRDSTGLILYYPAGSLSTSSSNWLKVVPGEQFTLQPKEVKNFTVMMQLPEKVDSLRNSMIFFTQLNGDSTKDEKGMNILLNVRVGVQVIYTPPSAQKTDLEILRMMDLDTAVAVTFLNTGQLEANGKANCDLTHSLSGKKMSLKELHFYTLPNGLRTLRWGFPGGIPKGKYTATVMLDTGMEHELKIGELEFTYD